MGDDFRTNVFREAGEAIGNVGRRLFRRKPKASEADEALQRWLDRVPLPSIVVGGQVAKEPDDDVIETTYRVIDENEGEQQ